MTEFFNYRVVLHFKDGTETLGLISNVDSSQICLGSDTYQSSLVRDLKVVQVPEMRKKKHGSGAGGTHMSTPQSLSRADTPRVQKKQPDWGIDNGNVKALQDFDFAANLAMFDKKSVFADFEKNEHTDVLARLVSLNKTSDKYDSDENVLTGQNSDNWHNIGSLSQRLTLPTPSAVPAKPSGLAKLFSLRYEDESAVVPLASPVQLLEIERLSAENFSVNQKALTEVCAANLYLLILTRILGGSRLNQRKNHNLPPLVLLLVGGGRSSGRAFALARHLTNHGVRVLAYVVSADMLEGDTLELCQQFEKCGGKVVSTTFDELLDILLRQLDTPVELIVDSLQGLEGQLSDLYYTPERMATLTRVVGWANEPQQSCKVLSLDISAGLDAGSGTASLPALVVHSLYIVSMGLPLSGIVHAYNNGTLGDDVTHYAVDVGVPNAVYRSRSHLRKFDKFWFCAELYMRHVAKSAAI